MAALIAEEEGMQEPLRSLCIRIAGNTENPCLLALRAKGYKLRLWFTKDRPGGYNQNFDAEKGGRCFSATTAAELLGLVAMWETQGDDWQTRAGEPCVHDELYPSSIAYDAGGAVVGVGDQGVRR
jgi:hypothetical protein